MPWPGLDQIGDDLWRTRAPWRYDVDGIVVTVPAGVVTDLASVPRPLWVVSGYAPFELRSGPVLHDYLYQRRGEVLEGTFTRAEADRLLYRVMRQDGISRARAWTVYAGVRVGGWRPWSRYAQPVPAVSP